MKYITIAALALLAAPAAADELDLPLTTTEIADAHNCFMGTMLTICAGEKKISTGIVMAEKMAMKPVPDWWLDKLSDDQKLDMRWTQPESFAAISMLKQPNPEWSRSYYVVDDDQLRRIVENARRDPNYDPTK